MKPTLVLQREDWDCVVACIASVLDITYEEVYSKLEELNIPKKAIGSLDELNIIDSFFGNASVHSLIRLPDGTFRFQIDKAYLVSLPSLTNPWGMLHRCVLYVEDGQLILLDPLDGEKVLENKPYNFTDVLEITYGWE